MQSHPRLVYRNGHNSRPLRALKCVACFVVQSESRERLSEVLFRSCVGLLKIKSRAARSSGAGSPRSMPATVDFTMGTPAFVVSARLQR